MMRKNLTEKNRADLKNQCKMGLAISLMVFMFATFIGITVYEMAFDSANPGLNSSMAASIAGGALLLSSLINIFINRKYYSDLRNNEKVQLLKKLTHKSKSNDAISFKGENLSKSYLNRFEFVVDDVAFLVDEALYESCEEGDTMVLGYASKSNFLLEIEKG